MKLFFRTFAILSVVFIFHIKTGVTYASLPLSGTFIDPDITYTSEAEYRTFFDELKASGMKTLILALASNLSKNCTTNEYTELVLPPFDYVGYEPWFPLVTKLAKEYDMELYFSVANFPVNSCIHMTIGSVNDESTDYGRLVGLSVRTVDAVKTMVADLGISWDDPVIAGFYISPELDTRYITNPDDPNIRLFRDISARIKERAPTKKILISPFQYEDATYDISLAAYKNLYGLTSVDIIAPQDSMGTGVTQTFQSSAEHFRALHDARALFPAKAAWANIEIFNTNSTPADIGRIRNQIDAARPHVSNLITWIYTIHMMSNPLSDNISSVNIYAPMYTRENAVKRTDLRRKYLNTYGATDWNIQNIYTSDSQYLQIVGTYGVNGTSRKMVVLYIDSNGSIIRKMWDFTSTGQLQNVAIPMANLPLFTHTKPYTAFVSDVFFKNETPRSMFYCRTSSNSCSLTSGLYVDHKICEENLRMHAPNQTSEVCVDTQSSCQQICASSPPVVILGDLDNSGHVDIFDYNLFVTDFSKTGISGFIPADIDRTGSVDMSDYSILIQNFGR